MLSLLVVLTLHSLQTDSFSQVKELISISKNFSYSAYVDAYYSYDNDKTDYFAPRLFATTAPYRDQFGLNIAQASLKYNSEKVRGMFTLQFGDIPEADFGPVTRSKYIQEANAGFSPAKNFWIDAGYFLTHIGTESIPRTNILSTFSLPGNFEPLFQSGIKFSYDFSDKFSGSLLVLNGYNLFEDNNKNKSAGVQLSYAPNSRLNFVYNNIFGNEQPQGTIGKTRLLNNFIVYYNPTEKTEVVAMFDYGMQEKSKFSDTTKSGDFYGATITGRYRFIPQFSAALRGEFFQDLNAIVSPVLSDGRGVKANAVSLGIEYRPVEEAFLRLEYRFIKMDAAQKIFSGNSDSRSEATISMGLEY